ncbi:MAG: excinuclease ABC subunit UvrA [Candidatus Parcubacteria bacterium]|nr:excinuclease ABC subunit UvrA [Candidatus Parcubacteria bacterium]
MPKQDKIIIRGARVHNLKNINVEIPKNKFIVITGLSGSGKSSLAFDTIFAEGQRQYVESLSSYARQFIGVMDKPDVDQIEGLSPVIAIDQKTTSNNPRSTVGTITEIYDYLRLLFTRIGIVHCPKCGQPIKKLTAQQIVERVFELPPQTRVAVLAPIIIGKKGKLDHVIKKMKKAEFYQLRLDGKIFSMHELEKMMIDEEAEHNMDVLIDYVFVEKTSLEKIHKTALYQAVDKALDLANGMVTILRRDNNQEQTYSQHLHCPKCNINLPEIELRSFSFNSPVGACPKCTGLGVRLEIDPLLVVFNPRLTIEQGAIKVWTRLTANQPIMNKLLQTVARNYKVPLDKPVEKIKKEELDIILYGTGEEEFEIEGKKHEFEGIIPYLEKKYRETDSEYVQKEIEDYMREIICPTCQGKRLKPESLAVTVLDKNISELVNMDLQTLYDFFDLVEKNSKAGLYRTEANKGKLNLTENEYKIAQQLIKEVKRRLEYLNAVSLDYLTLDRSATTLAGGEAQRIRLAKQISSSLTEIIYVLDEPSIGLHQRDNKRLIDALKKLRDMGNTVIVVEHDEAIMKEADLIVDIGPGAGEYGGQLVDIGTMDKIKKNKESLTGLYLSGKYKIEPRKVYRKGNNKFITIKGATANNLKNVEGKIPLGKFVAVSGVSGSGKSTLIIDILSRALAKHFFRAKEQPAEHKEIVGLDNLDKVVTVDQSPIGRTPRSNPATYTGVFTYIRDLYTQIPEAKMRGFDAGKFSFNVVGGRCEACAGEGLVRIEMQFLPDVYIECEECHGSRYLKDALEIYYKGKNIAEVLDMPVEEAKRFFSDIPIIHDKLMILCDVGLGYVKLGQPATTLSGGEAQRVKLATELSRRATGKTLYILDEPTTGLHFDDINRLLGVLQKLVDKGNTILVIEHNLDVIKSADWVIDMGPEGGDKGGYIVAQGTPKDIIKVKNSYTGQFLKKMI